MSTIANVQSDEKPPKKRNPPKRRPNYNVIHSKPLPLEIHPLPAFHPSHPISLVRLVYAYLSEFLWPQTSHPSSPYLGYFSPETHSVHVTDPRYVLALWEMGFFGKGTLSRSEPSWLEREKARLRQERVGAEAATNARREARRLFKLERARAEREKIERQRLIEEGKLDPLELVDATKLPESASTNDEDATRRLETVNGSPPEEPPIPLESNDTTRITHSKAIAEDEDDLIGAEPDVLNEEHLQLTCEEAFFLSYGLGVLSIYADSTSSTVLTPHQALNTFAKTSSSILPDFAASPLSNPTATTKTMISHLDPSSPFLLNYVVYHHFRSLGWVVRPGVKFGVDYLLYNRGPVFAHAEFAIFIIPTYSNIYWKTSKTSDANRQRRGKNKDWWWLHCVNRVQSQVLKTLVLCYVDVPPPLASSSSISPSASSQSVVPATAAQNFSKGTYDDSHRGDIQQLLKRYVVREFIIRRWVPNRSRD